MSAPWCKKCLYSYFFKDCGAKNLSFYCLSGKSMRNKILFGSLSLIFVSLFIVNAVFAASSSSASPKPNESAAMKNSTINTKKVMEKKEAANTKLKKTLSKTSSNLDYKFCPDRKAASCTIIYHDPGSGEDVLETPNKTPEKNGRSNNVIILGTSIFLEVGLFDNQLHKMQSDFSKYASIQKPPVKEISITKKSIKRINTDEKTGKNSIDFIITVDRKKTLNAKIIYSGLNKIVLRIYNPKNGTLLYASK